MINKRFLGKGGVVDYQTSNTAYDKLAFIADNYPDMVKMYDTIMAHLKLPSSEGGSGCLFSDKFNIHTITEDTYTLEDSDFDGNTLVRCTSDNSAVNITIPSPPSEDFIGSGITIRKSNGNQNTLLNLLPSNGVTITPLDITPLRRIGSTVVLVYVGNGIYEAFGELP